MNKSHDSEHQFFRLWLRPGGDTDCLPYCLANNEINIGWGGIVGLTNPSLTRVDFRNACKKSRYHVNEKDYRGAGATGGQLWRFIREMQVGDLVAVPDKSEPRSVYFAIVLGQAEYERNHMGMGEKYDVDYFRRARWLNKDEPMPASRIPTALRNAIFSQRAVRNLSAFSRQAVKLIRG